MDFVTEYMLLQKFHKRYMYRGLLQKKKKKVKLFLWQTVQAYKVVRCWESHIV
jgi:hypothetical protein